MLFPIPLQGALTADVESFASYLHRIARMHGLFVGELIKFVCRRLPAEVKEKYGGTIPHYMTVEELTQPDMRTGFLIEVFEKSTGQSLRGSMPQFLSGSVGRSLGEVHKGFRWCSECAKVRSAGIF